MRLQKIEQIEILNNSIFNHNKKRIPKSCTSSPWHISDRSECWPIPSQCL